MGAAKAVAGNLSGGFFVSALRSWDGTVWGTQLCGFVLGKPPPETQPPGGGFLHSFLMIPNARTPAHRWGLRNLTEQNPI